MAQDDDIYDDLEQSERARSWFQNNGSSLVVGVMAAMAVIWGYKAFETNKVRQAHEAGIGFELLTQAASEKKDLEVKQLAADLRRSHGDSTYAAMGSLVEAKYLADAGKSADAETALRFASEAGSTEALKTLANLRIARMLAGSGKAQDALTILNGLNDEGFKGLVQTQKGDSYVQLGKLAEAKAAYAAALTATDLASPGRATLQQKLDNLGG